MALIVKSGDALDWDNLRMVIGALDTAAENFKKMELDEEGYDFEIERLKIFMGKAEMRSAELRAEEMKEKGFTLDRYKDKRGVRHWRKASGRFAKRPR